MAAVVMVIWSTSVVIAQTRKGEANWFTVTGTVVDEKGGAVSRAETESAQASPTVVAQLGASPAEIVKRYVLKPQSAAIPSHYTPDGTLADAVSVRGSSASWASPESTSWN